LKQSASSTFDELEDGMVRTIEAIPRELYSMFVRVGEGGWRHALRGTETTLSQRCLNMHKYQRFNKRKWVSPSSDSRPCRISECPNEWVLEWMNAWMTEWINEWANAWVSEWRNEWVDQSLNPWMNKNLNWWMNPSMNEWLNPEMNAEMNVWLDAWMNDWITKRLNESMNEWVPECLNHNHFKKVATSLKGGNVDQRPTKDDNPLQRQ
jgi:hypothetical protein